MISRDTASDLAILLEYTSFYTYTCAVRRLLSTLISLIKMATSDSVKTLNTLSDLPTEIHLNILARLPFDAKARLRSTSRYFHSLILPFSLHDLLVAEGEDYAVARDLLTCTYCLRLLHKSEFGDKMTKKGKGRRGSKSHNRFCVECGLYPPLSCTGYGREQFVKWGGQEFVVVFCLRCRKMELALAEDDGKLGECRRCQKRRMDVQRQKEKHERRVRRKAEREAWHRRMEEIWGSNQSSCEEFDDTDSN